MAVPLGSHKAVGEQHKAHEARSASLGDGSRPFNCFGAKNLQYINRGSFRPTIQMQGLKKATEAQLNS